MRSTQCLWIEGGTGARPARPWLVSASICSFYASGLFHWNSCHISRVKGGSWNVRVWILPQVICCEGNAGFYEVGCMNTPLEGEESTPLGVEIVYYAKEQNVSFCEMVVFCLNLAKPWLAVHCRRLLCPGLEPPGLCRQYGKKQCFHWLTHSWTNNAVETITACFNWTVFHKRMKYMVNVVTGVK